MKAAVYEKFGGPEVVSVVEVPTPVPGPGEVLIRVRASTVSAGDHRMRARDLPKGFGLIAFAVVGVFGPRKRILGMDFAGVVEAVGEGVMAYQPGDALIGLTGDRFGGHAEFVCLPETAAMAPMPRDWSFTDAVSLVFGGHTVSNCLKQVTIGPGTEVLVNGAAGAVGSAAVQAAKHLGARVTGVCSAASAELVRALGADEVIDYAQEDFATSGKTYHVIFECVGNAPFGRVEGALKPGGTLLLVIGDLPAMLSAGRNSRRTGKQIKIISFKPTVEDVAFEAQLAEAGAMQPVIDSVFPLEQIVEAHRRTDTGHKRGAVVVTMAP